MDNISVVPSTEPVPASELGTTVPPSEPGTGAEILLSVREAADRLGIGERAVRKRIAAGTLNGVKGAGGVWYVALHQSSAPAQPEPSEPIRFPQRNRADRGTQNHGADPGTGTSSDPGTAAAHPAGPTLTARTQLDLIMSEWLAPLVNRIGSLERENGRLETRITQLETELTAAQTSAIPPAAPTTPTDSPAPADDRSISPRSKSRVAPAQPRLGGFWRWLGLR
jgi:hypothetical protein